MSREVSSLLLPPLVAGDLFERLLAIPRPTADHPTLRVLSVFRLDDYENKGGPELVGAVTQLRSEGHDITLTIAGIAGREALLNAPPCDDWLRVVPSPSSEQLVTLYTEADVFVLATRQHRSPHPAGEGFGIVLAEAALAGLPVVAPANDGSSDAFLPGITGLRPSDQSALTLGIALRWVAEHRVEARLMGRNGRAWARRAFDPSVYRDRVASVFLERGTPHQWLGLAFESERAVTFSNDINCRTNDTQ
jgi:glycosyltransferase involved in cell wall biosynthesis